VEADELDLPERLYIYIYRERERERERELTKFLYYRWRQTR
jgi:hypothetical protein